MKVFVLITMLNGVPVAESTHISMYECMGNQQQVMRQVRENPMSPWESICVIRDDKTSANIDMFKMWITELTSNECKE